VLICGSGGHPAAIRLRGPRLIRPARMRKGSIMPTTVGRSAPMLLARLALVFRSFLVLSLVCGSWGHADGEWFVDLGG
jgi:hypothetical protein